MATATTEQRREALARQISTLVVQGRRVESQDDYQAVLVRGRGPLERRELVTIDESGNPMVQDLPLDKERLIVVGAFIAAILLLIIVVLLSGNDSSGDRDDGTNVVGSLGLTLRHPRLILNPVLPRFRRDDL